MITPRNNPVITTMKFTELWHVQAVSNIVSIHKRVIASDVILDPESNTGIVFQYFTNNKKCRIIKQNSKQAKITTKPKDGDIHNYSEFHSPKILLT